MTIFLSDSAFADAGIPMAFVVPSDERGGLGLIQSANGAMAFFTGRSMEELTGLALQSLCTATMSPSGKTSSPD